MVPRRRECAGCAWCVNRATWRILDPSHERSLTQFPLVALHAIGRSFLMDLVRHLPDGLSCSHGQTVGSTHDLLLQATGLYGGRCVIIPRRLSWGGTTLCQEPTHDQRLSQTCIEGRTWVINPVGTIRYWVRCTVVLCTSMPTRGIEATRRTST